MRVAPLCGLGVMCWCSLLPDFAAWGAPGGPYSVPEPQPVASSLLVGCYYFPGHFSPMRWVPMARFGHPYPLLGYYRDEEPEVLDWHIKWAVEHGIDFFAFDWYYDYKTGHVHTHNNALERGFLHARYRELMQFCIFWCNEENGDVDYTEEQMLRLARTLRERYLNQSNYLRLEGRPVVIVSCPERLLRRFGVEGCAEMWRKMSAEAGVELFPVAKQDTEQQMLARAGYMACTAYNYAGANMPPGERRSPYEMMVLGYEERWREASRGPLPYIVPLSPGWDSRPWHGEDAMVRTNPRPEKFRCMCQAAWKYVNPRLNAVIIECWNEFGEGSYIEPCTQYGFGYLDAVRDVFCPDNPHHLDVTPQQVGARVPVYEELPTLTEAEVAAQGGNLIYNPGFEKTWGWVYFDEADARTDDTVAHSGRRSGVVTPQEQGIKTLWKVAVAPGEELEVWAWVRTEEGASAHVACALFGADGNWLRRYLDLGDASGGEWRHVAKRMVWEDAEARQVDLEVAPRGGTVWVDDVGIRRVGGGPE